MEYLVINEAVWAEVQPEDSDGNRKFWVINGHWEGVFNKHSNIGYCCAFPDATYQVTSVRPAVAGECPPYF